MAFIDRVYYDVAAGERDVVAQGALHGDATEVKTVVFELAVQALVVVLLVVEVGLHTGKGRRCEEEEEGDGGGEMHIELAA